MKYFAWFNYILFDRKNKIIFSLNVIAHHSRYLFVLHEVFCTQRCVKGARQQACLNQNITHLFILLFRFQEYWYQHKPTTNKDSHNSCKCQYNNPQLRFFIHYYPPWIWRVDSQNSAFLYGLQLQNRTGRILQVSQRVLLWLF